MMYVCRFNFIYLQTMRFYGTDWLWQRVEAVGKHAELWRSSSIIARSSNYNWRK